MHNTTATENRYTQTSTIDRGASEQDRITNIEKYNQITSLIAKIYFIQINTQIHQNNSHHTFTT